jgi:hypothetical protein
MKSQILIRLTAEEVTSIISEELRGITAGRHRRKRRTHASDHDKAEADRLAGQIVEHLIKCGVVFVRGKSIGDAAHILRGSAS